MIRIFFWLALLVNLALFAYIQWGGSLTRDANNLLPPLNPEQIKLLGFSPAAPSSAAVSAPAVAAASAPEVPQPALAGAGAVPASAASTTTCMEWGEFSGTDLARANEELAGLKLGSKLTQREIEHSIGYWVYIPPRKTPAEVNTKISQLKELGVSEYFVVQEKGQWQYAISLGVFKTEDVANKFLAHLKAKGVRSAIIGERQTRLKFTVFVLKNPAPATLTKLAEWQKDFTGIEMKSAACN